MTGSWSDELERLPAPLSGADVRMAIAEHADPIAWPEDTRYLDAELPAAMSRLVRKAWHQDLEGARIAHLYRQQLGGSDPCRIVARAKRASPELRHLGRVDFVITYSYRSWMELDLTQRLALIDHELSHCSKNEHGWLTIPHDLAEFGNIVRRWGAWHPGITAFRGQLDLFETQQQEGRGP